MDENGSTPLLKSFVLGGSLEPLCLQHYLLCCSDTTNPETSPALAAAALIYLAHSQPENIDYSDAKNVWNSLIDNIDVFAEVSIPWTETPTLFFTLPTGFMKKSDCEDLEKLHREMKKKLIAKLINLETPQNVEQRQIQQDYLHIFYSENDESFLQEMLATVVEKGRIHLLSPLSEFVDINLPWEGMTPLQRAKSQEMRERLIELGAKEGS